MKKLVAVVAVIAMLTSTAIAEEEIRYKVITDDGIENVNIYGFEQIALDNQRIIAAYEVTDEELVPVVCGFDGANFATYDSVSEIEYIN